MKQILVNELKTQLNKIETKIDKLLFNNQYNLICSLDSSEKGLYGGWGKCSKAMTGECFDTGEHCDQCLKEKLNARIND